MICVLSASGMAPAGDRKGEPEEGAGTAVPRVLRGVGARPAAADIASPAEVLAGASPIALLEVALFSSAPILCPMLDREDLMSESAIMSSTFWAGASGAAGGLLFLRGAALMIF